MWHVSMCVWVYYSLCITQTMQPISFKESALLKFEYLFPLCFFQIKYPWFKNITVVTSIMHYTKVNEVSVRFTNVTLSKSTWTISGLNVFANNSILHIMKISPEINISQPRNKIVKISNSTWQQLNVSSGFHIKISDCKFNSSTILETFINIKHSMLNMRKCKFENLQKSNSGPAILYAENSVVEMSNIHCHKNYATNGLIQIKNNSQLCMEKSTFKKNGYDLLFSSAIVSSEFNSVVHISNSKFNDNTGLLGSCLYGDSNTTVILRNSSFVNNSAVKGGVIFSQNIPGSLGGQSNETGHVNELSKNETLFSLKDRNEGESTQENIHTYITDDSIPSSIIDIQTCNFDSNAAYKGAAVYIKGFSIELSIYECNFANQATITGALHVEGTKGIFIHVFISECNFDGNTGADIYISRTVIEISTCKFLNSSGLEGGSIDAREHCILNITKCIFSGDFGFFNAVVNVQQAVELNIFDSLFCSIPFAVGFSFISSFGKCWIKVVRSYFTNDNTIPAYTIVFNIENTTSLVVTDSQFKTSRGLDLVILSASQNCQIYFTNCSFNKVSGFQASHNTSVHISNSKITHCINSLQSHGFIHLWDGSQLNISNTTMAHNKVLETDTMILAQTNSSLTLSKCLYEENKMSSHIMVKDNSDIDINHCRFLKNHIIKGHHKATKALLVIHDSNIIVNECHFSKNIIKVEGGQVMEISKSNVTVVGSNFHQNNVYGGDSFADGLNLIGVQLSKKVNFRNTMFFDNVVLSVLSVKSKIRSINSFLQINNCSFKASLPISISSTNISDIIITNSHFMDARHHEPKWVDLPDLDIENAMTVRIQDSTFNATKVRSQFYFERESSFRNVLKLFTLNSNFTLGNTTLQTSAEDFLQKAKELDLIDTGLLFGHMEQMETEYVSSKYCKGHIIVVDDGVVVILLLVTIY